MDYIKYINDKKKIIDEALDKYLPPEDKTPTIIHKAMRYSVFSGGKRLRPVLTLATAELLGINEKKVLYTACGIELIHTFSLIHDDLPCIDDDDFRRGKPSCHKVFGESIALLAGDALLISAFELIIKNSEVKGIKKKIILDLFLEIVHLIGTENMLGGQVDDILHEKKEDNKKYLYSLYKRKTAALICASIRASTFLAEAKQREIKALTKYGENIGLAFQITDDILDIMQDQRDMDKITFPSEFGIKNAKSESERLIEEAKKALNIFDKNKTEFFNDLADYIISRKK